MARLLGVLALLAGLLSMTVPGPVHSAACYFSAKDKKVVEPVEEIFITWDPKERVETFTLQPRYTGNTPDFGMVIATPAQPRLDEMPKDFFKELAVFTMLKRREAPASKLVSQLVAGRLARLEELKAGPGAKAGSGINELETGTIGSQAYKIITADKAGDLYTWLKENNYNYAGDEVTLDSYIQKKWFFTVVKIDTSKLKKNPDGTFSGDVTPMRFQFASDKLIYPLKITRLSVKDKIDVLFYVQAPTKVDLPGEMTYQYLWIPMLDQSLGQYVKGTFGSHHLPGKGDDWLNASAAKSPGLLRRGEELGFEFVRGQRPEPNRQGRTPTMLEWAKRLTSDDIRLLKGEAAFSETLPDVDEGFTEADMKDPGKTASVRKTIHERLEKFRQERPGGYLVREAAPGDIKQLKTLVGYLKEGQFLTKFRKTFTKGEMDDDLLIVPAALGNAEDHSEYEEYLPTSPP
jgi:Uncharacterized protein conserved in bacteria (DUF2330)